jgi:Tol biopolymer transport system component
MNVDGSGKRKLTEDYEDDQSPYFSPDGKRIVFMRVDGGDWHKFNIWAMNSDGTEQVRLTNDSKNNRYLIWSR